MGALLSSPWFRAFLAIFVLRYFRLFVAIIAYHTSRSVPITPHPTYTEDHVTVILPVEAPTSEEFQECFGRIFANRPAQIFVVTTGREKVQLVKDFCISKAFVDKVTRVTVLDCPKRSKRERLVYALRKVRTEFVVQCDETVFWPFLFLPHVLAPFENPCVGIVGTCKRVRRFPEMRGFDGFLNLCGILRLERTNFDLAASHAVDGGCSCVSGRTCAWRTAILQNEPFIYDFTHEMVAGNGPLNAGDDKFITLWMIRHGWKVRHQSCPEARIETILGISKGGANQSAAQKFIAQLIRWARTSARDNPAALFASWNLIYRYPWTATAVFFNSIFNYAALWDPAIMLTFYVALQDGQVSFALGGIKKPMYLLVAWICLSKLVKGAGHFWRYPADICYVPFVVLFAYFHSGIKLWATITKNNISWGSREGVDEHTAKQ
ncbi:glycosyltransferase family 2 protein [Saccharata proteae CBS 121410]|uniref:Glycosyltransferase family 2 protein n=1 Tax=Saccharata proteae CBS 121410 TaxID=1314787 RepID=A0A6A5YE45_9PEZI|nr:glycosyltransferase family 2 protein [Saccharata proteae CBS 121410]